MDIPIEYKNLTEIAEANGIRLDSWANRPVGKKAIFDFRVKYPEIEQPLITKIGKGGGTYAHPELAAIFIAWCDPAFIGELVKQNALLKEKIRTFKVNTPAEIRAAKCEAEAVKTLAHQVAVKGEEEIELIAKCHFARGVGQHPEGTTFALYLPHWLSSFRHRTDMFPREVLELMIHKAGYPIKIGGKVLKQGYTYVWI